MSLRPFISPHQYGGSTLVTGPLIEPVTATELQTHLRVNNITFPDMDAEVLITVAREYLEEITALTMIDQTWELTLDNWPGFRDIWWDGVRDGAITELNRNQNQIVELDRYPLDSITSITVFSANSTPTVINVVDTFDVDTKQTPGRFTIKSGGTWPTYDRQLNAIEIVYIAGYGLLATDVPAPIKRAILQAAAYLYTHRGDGCDVESAYKKSGAASLLGIYDVKRI